MMKLQALLLAAFMAGASGFAPYAGPDLESFDFVYQVPDGPGLHIAGFKPRGRDAPAVVFLPYGIIPYEDQLPFFLPAMEAVAQRGFAVALVEYPDIELYPDQAGSADLEKVCSGPGKAPLGHLGARRAVWQSARTIRRYFVTGLSATAALLGLLQRRRPEEKLHPTGLRRRLLRRPGRGISFLVRTARNCDPPQLVQQPDRRILRAGRDQSLAGRRHVRVAPGRRVRPVRPVNAHTNPP